VKGNANAIDKKDIDIVCSNYNYLYWRKIFSVGIPILDVFDKMLKKYLKWVYKYKLKNTLE